MAKANPLGDLEYDVDNSGFGDGNSMEASCHRSQVKVKGDLHPAPAPTSRTELEQRKGHWGSGKDISGVHDAGQNP